MRFSELYICTLYICAYIVTTKKNLKFAFYIFQGLPYGADTAFGYTTIIDPKLSMLKMAKSCYSTAMDHEHFGMNQAEMNTIDCLIEGKIISKLAFPRVDERVKHLSK